MKYLKLLLIPLFFLVGSIAHGAETTFWSYDTTVSYDNPYTTTQECAYFIASTTNITKAEVRILSIAGSGSNPTIKATLYNAGETAIASSSNVTITGGGWWAFSLGTTTITQYDPYMICFSHTSGTSKYANFYYNNNDTQAFRRKVQAKTQASLTVSTAWSSGYPQYQFALKLYYDTTYGSTPSCEDDLTQCEADLSTCQADLASSIPTEFSLDSTYNKVLAISNYYYDTTTTSTLLQVQTQYTFPLEGYFIIAVVLWFLFVMIFVIYSLK